MSRGQDWIFVCSFVVLAIAITGVCLAVTPVAAFATQVNHFTYNGALATTLHNQVTNLNALPAQTNSRLSADVCLLCYSPSHVLLSHLSRWMGK